MGNFKKCKIVALLMAAMVCGSTISVPSVAVAAETQEEVFDATAHGEVVETGECGRSIDYTLYEDGMLYIHGSGKMKNYNYFDVKSPFSDNLNIKAAYIEAGISQIGTDTFYECQALSEITIPKSVTTIGELAFEGTPWLKNKIKENPMVIVNNILIDGKSCSGAVNIPEGVTQIAESAFMENTKITAITVPSGVVSIENQAFCACKNLLTVQLPDGLSKIGKYAFSECGELMKITMPEKLTELGEGAFSDCYKLSSIKIPSGLSVINPYTFWMCDGLKQVTIPEGTTTIGAYAFGNCLNLQYVTIEKAVNVIKEYAFTYCDNLKGIAIPVTVRKINDLTFADCYGDFTIYGESGSEAENFAKANNIPFSTTTMEVPKENIPDEGEVINLAGDVDGNGKVQLNDAQLTLKIALKIIELDAEMTAKADIDNNGTVTLSDAQKILKIALKIE